VERYDPRRQQSIALRAAGDDCVYVEIDGALWSEVEWSASRQAWCIQDAEGHCLTHVESIRATAATKAEAITLATAMIRDGRMPSPELARRERGKVRR